MAYKDNSNNYIFYKKQCEKECNHEHSHTNCCETHSVCKKCGSGFCINNNPVIKINVCGSDGGTEPRPFLSGYMEALGSSQTVARNNSIVFDIESIETVGNDVELDASGTTFTINRPGLYHIEWNLNLASDTTSAVVGILENGEPASGSATTTGGNFASGTIINVTEVPFTISLHNYNGEITLEDISPFEDSAASIRIVRFADGPSV